MISIVSVPHTGTQFTQKILADMDLDVRCTHAHSTHPLQDPNVWVEEGGKVVIPWRDPDLARISALNRGHEPRPLSEYADLLKWAERDNVHLFTVEPGSDEAKDAELLALQAFLGCEDAPETDWAPVNESEDVTGLKAAHTAHPRKAIKWMGFG